MKTYLLIALLLSFSAQAQQGNIWYFGNHAGVDFNTGTPVALMDGQIASREGCATIADANGQLLFYTDGVTVWDKTHHVMPNGTGLAGHQSSTQSAVIVPKPGTATLYYIFTTDAQAGSNGLRYSIVDITLNDGLGNITDAKNIPVYFPSCEKLTVAKHSNGTDYWVITHGWNSNTYYASLLTAAGLNAPVTSNAGVVVYYEEGTNNYAGNLKVSPDGSKLAACHSSVLGTLEVLDFNNTTGIVSNGQVLRAAHTPGSTMYGVEFSPNSTILYATHILNGTLYQYNLAAPDIPATEVLFSSNAQLACALQLGPDGRIYIAYSGFGSLGAINYPNVAGTGCTVQPDAVSLGTKTSFAGLPAFVQSFFYPTLQLELQDGCVGTAVPFAIASAHTVMSTLWDFGDGTTLNSIDALHTYTAPGTYNVSAVVTTAMGTNTIARQIIVFDNPQAATPNNMQLCDDNGTGQQLFNLALQDAPILGTQNPAGYTVTYHALLQDAQAGNNALPTLFANTAGTQDIFARVTNNATGCHATTAFTIAVYTFPDVIMDTAYGLCKGSTLTITAPGGFDGYEWSGGATTQSVEIGDTGSISLTLFKNNQGLVCHATRQITIVASKKAVIRDISINDWTENANSIYITAEGPGNYEYSLDGLTYQDSPEFTNLRRGLYTVYVKDKYGCGIALKKIALLNYPHYFSPNGDGIHDNWAIQYSMHEPAMMVAIYNRAGKLITTFKGGDAGWDGTFNGHNLPSDDYWFVVQRQDGRHYKGHFAMIR